MFTVQCIMYNVQCTQYTVQCTCTVYTVHCTMCNAHPDDNSSSLTFFTSIAQISLSKGIFYILKKSPPTLSAFPSLTVLLYKIVIAVLVRPILTTGFATKPFSELTVTLHAFAYWIKVLNNANNTDLNAKLNLSSVNDPRGQELRTNAASICGDILKLCKSVNLMANLEGLTKI